MKLCEPFCGWFITAIQDGRVNRNACLTLFVGTFGFVFQCLLQILCSNHIFVVNMTFTFKAADAK